MKDNGTIGPSKAGFFVLRNLNKILNTIILLIQIISAVGMQCSSILTNAIKRSYKSNKLAY